MKFWRWFRPPRRFPPTREGWWFLAATLLVGVAAVNGGINLLFLIFGMMLSLILASGVLSEICLRNLRVVRRPPAMVHAGTPFLMGISVRNDKRRIPTFSLEVEDMLEGRPVDRRCYYLKLPAGRVQETAYKHVLSRRGRHQFVGFRLSTRFPFGFIRKSRDMESPTELLVYPALVPVPETSIRAGLAELGKRQKSLRSRSGDFHGLREYRQGDDPRDIHWATTARRGRPFIRESEEETGTSAVVVLENERGSTTTPTDEAAFEAAVSLAASVAVSLIRRGLQIGLRTADTSIPPGYGVAHAAQILACLALVQPASVATVSRALPPGAAVIRVTPGSPNAVVQGTGRGAERRTA